MKLSILSKTMVAVLAIGTFGAAVAATTSVYFSAGAPVATPAPIYVLPQSVYEAPPRTMHQRPVYVAQPAYAHDGRHGQGHAWRSACRAPGWYPQTRYMPGQVVWRHGTLYMATQLSASVWNVNSPPEWTPSYWVPANCT